MGKKPLHFHEYLKTKIGKDYVVYKCRLPGCSHYISPILVVGRLAQCPICGNVYTITRVMVRNGHMMRLPHCNKCTRGKRTTFDISKIQEILG